MPVRRVVVTSTYSEVDDGGVTRRVTYSSITGNTWTRQRLSRLVAAIQAGFDNVQPIADLPADDPDKTTDPARANVFWDGADIVYRGVFVHSPVVDGDKVHVTYSRAR